jgi:hypothetical protein
MHEYIPGLAYSDLGHDSCYKIDPRIGLSKLDTPQDRIIEDLG